jgi:glycerophosphoryl diester phosphodiesterase
VQQRLPSLLNEPILFAHRGASAYAPENTLDAFSLALKLGANGLESDIWVTRDGVLVLDHDGVVKSRLRSKPIAEMDRSALPSHIPSLEQLLQHCGTQYQLSLDVKDPVVFETIERTVALPSEVRLVNRQKIIHSKVQVCRFDSTSKDQGGTGTSRSNTCCKWH